MRESNSSCAKLPKYKPDLQAPAGTVLEVPKPERSDSYQIHLKSGAGQIYVVLVNRDRDSEEPLVMQVSQTNFSLYRIL